MHVDAWKIQGKAFHFGEHGLGQEETSITFHSDSLFAAILATVVERSGSKGLEDYLQPFLIGNPPYLITSTFPFAGDIRFYPLILTALRMQPDEDEARPSKESVDPKKLKKVRFVSESVFKNLLSGVPLKALYQKDLTFNSGALLIGKKDFASLPAALRNRDQSLWEVEQRPRVTVGRVAHNSSIYFTGRIWFGDDCGLWFGIRWLQEADRSALPEILAQLADNGLGAERNAGFGACKIHPSDELELPDPGSGHWTTLSRYLPKEDETKALQDSWAAFSLKRVGGWLQSPSLNGQRRRAVNLLVEGSVLGSVDRLAPGQIVDVKPVYRQDPGLKIHAVYRSGLAFPVGIKLSDS